MSLAGVIFEDVNHWESQSTVDRAVVTDTTIAVHWIRDGEEFYLRATSADGGIMYEGTFGAPTPCDDWQVFVRRYTSPKGHVSLLTKWYQDDHEKHGSFVIQLESEPTARKGQRKQASTPKIV